MLKGGVCSSYLFRGFAGVAYWNVFHLLEVTKPCFQPLKANTNTPDLSYMGISPGGLSLRVENFYFNLGQCTPFSCLAETFELSQPVTSTLKKKMQILNQRKKRQEKKSSTYWTRLHFLPSLRSRRVHAQLVTDCIAGIWARGNPSNPGASRSLRNSESLGTSWAILMSSDMFGSIIGETMMLRLNACRALSTVNRPQCTF